MIKSFNKEEFMSQPAEIKITQEMEYAYGSRTDSPICAFPHEQSIVITVGGEDHDVRDLVWRLKCAEANIDQLCERLVKLDCYCHALESRLGQQEARIF